MNKEIDTDRIDIAAVDNTMRVFADRLRELLTQRAWDIVRAERETGISRHTLRNWLTAANCIKLPNLLKVLDFFGCSAEYMAGRTDVFCDYAPRECPPFYPRLRAVMAERGVTRYAVLKYTRIPDSCFINWKRGASPNLFALAELSTSAVQSIISSGATGDATRCTAGKAAGNGS